MESLRRRRGFTVVELLVVIAIITTLIAILLPALTRVRQVGLKVSCQANLRNIGHALTIYTQQYGYYPGCALYINPDVPPSAIWPLRLRPILKGNQDVFYCPAQDPRCRWVKDAPGPVVLATDGAARYGYKAGERLIVAWGSFFSYGYNGNDGALGGGVSDGHGGDNPPTDRSAPPRITRIKSPSDMIAVGDTLADGFEDYLLQAWPYFPNNPVTSAPSIHHGGANVLFCDGHVQWYLQQDLVCAWPPVPQDGSKWKMWNIYNDPGFYPGQ